MLQVARLSSLLLSEGSDLVSDYVLGQMNPDGGFKDRVGQSDLYYTVFGLQCLAALRLDPPLDGVRSYLNGFGHGEDLDLVHICALARCLASVGMADKKVAHGILARVESFKTPDGGFHGVPDSNHTSAYGAFLALGAYQDLGISLPDLAGLARAVDSLKLGDGSYAIEPGQIVGTTPTTAAAESLLRTAGHPASAETGQWLLARAYAQGGFFAVPSAPMPDLLSTAVALHALAGMNLELGPIKETCLDFIDSLWVNKGSFFGNWGDEHLDCEYTFYGLLALGHLSL